MFTYYVSIPNSEAPTAEVEASSTKHARTSYLDYLSRNGRIGWKDRQNTRPLIKVSRMQPGEIQTQVRIDYSQGDMPTREIEAPTTDIDAGEFSETPSEFSPEELSELKSREAVGYYNRPAPLTGVRGNSLQSGGTKPRSSPIGSSPIEQLSRRSKGV